MKVFAIVLFILLVAGSSAFAQTEVPADSVMAEVWIANNLSSIIIAAAGREDSSAVNGANRFFWLENPKGSIQFLFLAYSNYDRKFVESYLPGLDYKKYPVCCLVMDNSGNVCLLRPLELSLFGRDRIRWAGGMPYFYDCFYLEGWGAEVFNFSNDLQAQDREEDY